MTSHPPPSPVHIITTTTFNISVCPPLHWCTGACNCLLHPVCKTIFLPPSSMCEKCLTIFFCPNRTNNSLTNRQPYSALHIKMKKGFAELKTLLT